MKGSSPLTRRRWLQSSASGLLAAGLWPGALRASDASQGEEFHFLAVNDTHYQSKRCGEWLERVLKRMKGHKDKIDFCLLVGDLVEHGTAEELGAVRDRLKGLGVPLYVVIGNHDYQAQDDRKAFEELFPQQINYHFAQHGWQFLGLDTTEGLRYRNTAVPAATLRWLDDTLPQLDQKRPTVVFTHFPLGARVTYRPTNAEEVLARFRDYNLQAVFSGHFHGFTERRAGTATLTTNRCCAISRHNHDGSKEKGYFLCQAKDGKVSRTFVEVRLS